MSEEVNLKDLNVPGFIRFSIKAKDTAENQSIHKAFKEFCAAEVDDNYTLGLRKLLEYYQGDFKYEVLYQEIADLKLELANLKDKINTTNSDESKEDSEDSGVFE